MNEYIYIYIYIYTYTGWGIKISNFSKGHCEGCSGGREVGVVSCGWLASTVSVSKMGWTDEHRGFVLVPWAFDLFKGRRGVAGKVT